MTIRPETDEDRAANYERFGFGRSDESGIEAPAGVDQQYFMVRPLEAYDPALRGRAVYSEAFLNLG